jgi:type IV pilus assembly protein PilW
MNSIDSSIGIFGNKDHMGFTLIELLITLLISSLIMAAVYSAYITQQRNQTAQNQVVEMQQNLRSAMSFLSSEIRMAGYKPPSNNESTGISSLAKGKIEFTWEKDSDDVANSPDIRIAYQFTNTDDLAPADGIADAGAASFRRKINGGNLQPVADDIVAVEFLYTLTDNTDNGSYDPLKKLTPSATEYKDITAVTISLLARSPHEDRNFTNNLIYQSASGQNWGPFDDGFRRRLLISTVQLRNIAL